MLEARGLVGPEHEISPLSPSTASEGSSAGTASTEAGVERVAPHGDAAVSEHEMDALVAHELMSRFPRRTAAGQTTQGPTRPGNGHFPKRGKLGRTQQNNTMCNTLCNTGLRVFSKTHMETQVPVVLALC